MKIDRLPFTTKPQNPLNAQGYHSNMNDTKIDPFRLSTPLGVRYRLRRNHRPYTREEVSALPRNRTGLYAIWLPSAEEGGEPDDRECIYIGKSETCIRRRLLDHLRPTEPNPELRRLLSYLLPLAQFSVAYTAYASETDALETSAVHILHPTANRNKRSPEELYYD